MKHWLCMVWMACALHAQAVQVTDDRGAVVQMAQAPQRIVTLLPSLTETVCELGACHRLVAVDNYSNWPASVRTLPRVGGLDDASIELIVSLRPDLVLLSSTSRAMARLEALGVRVMGLELKTLPDVHRVLGKVGQVLGVGGADQVWQRIDAGIDAAARSVPPSARGTSVYFEVSSGPYAASESSHIGEILRRIGAANVVPGRLGTVPKLNPEFVVRADPQVIMISDHNPQAVSERPGWSGIRAVRNRRVCTFTAAQGDIIVRPGPRLAESAQLLADCLLGRLNGRAP